MKHISKMRTSATKIAALAAKKTLSIVNCQLSIIAAIMIFAASCGQSQPKTAATPQQETEQKVCDNAEFEGEWSWSSEDISNDITITNVTQKSFTFSFFGMFTTSYGVPHTGGLEDQTAYFTAPNTALFEYSNEEISDETGTINFVLKDGKLFVTATDNCYLIGFGVGVRIDGEYVKNN